MKNNHQDRAFLTGAIAGLCRDVMDRYNPAGKDAYDPLSCLYQELSLHRLVIDTISVLDSISATDKNAYVFYRDNLAALCNDLLVASVDEVNDQTDSFWSGYHAATVDVCLALDFDDLA